MHREHFFGGRRTGGRSRRRGGSPPEGAPPFDGPGGHGMPGPGGHGGPPFPPFPPFFSRGPFGDHGFFGHHWGGGRRARRGDIRTALLALLAEKPMHGYDLMRELTERSGGLWRPSAGSVYPTLQMMEEEGLVTGEDIEGRRTFSLTSKGRAEHAASAQRSGGAPPWEARGANREDLSELREAAFQLGAAVSQIARLSSPAQIAEALAIIKEARRKLYRLLADAP